MVGTYLDDSRNVGRKQENGSEQQEDMTRMISRSVKELLAAIAEVLAKPWWVGNQLEFSRCCS